MVFLQSFFHCRTNRFANELFLFNLDPSFSWMNIDINTLWVQGKLQHKNGMPIHKKQSMVSFIECSGDFFTPYPAAIDDEHLLLGIMANLCRCANKPGNLHRSE